VSLSLSEWICPSYADELLGYDAKGPEMDSVLAKFSMDDDRQDSFAKTDEEHTPLGKLSPALSHDTAIITLLTTTYIRIAC
jgi:hypothetical protein